MKVINMGVEQRTGLRYQGNLVNAGIFESVKTSQV